ncbi:MAG: SMP-30/gluconolactonase/LRE family protein [Planctomycetota bacterium]|nr:SMP-30/gluconolactonase/LRE family protein [Planctomycetota bacterium]
MSQALDLRDKFVEFVRPRAITATFIQSVRDDALFSGESADVEPFASHPQPQATPHETFMIQFQALSTPDDFLADSHEVTPATTVAFTEGPAAAADGAVYFSDISNNRIMRFDTKSGRQSVWRQPSGRANGLLFDPQGRLLACEGNEFGDNDGNRRITRTDLTTGNMEVLTERFEGARYNAPNDIMATTNGFIFFTDPCYGDRSTMETPHESVYRIDPAGTVTRAITQPDIERPNGIALSPDERTLYLVDSCPLVGGNRKIWAFDLKTGKSAISAS